MHVLREGKEAGQGVAYLDDGTMVVVEQGRRHIGQTVNVMVNTVLQTAAGRMIFTRLAEEDPRAADEPPPGGETRRLGRGPGRRPGWHGPEEAGHPGEGPARASVDPRRVGGDPRGAGDRGRGSGRGRPGLAASPPRVPEGPGRGGRRRGAPGVGRSRSRGRAAHGGRDPGPRRRPAVHPPELVRRVVEATRAHGAAVAALPVAETLKRGAEGWVKATIPRDGLWAIQTPQGFRAELLREAHRRAAADRIVGTDDAALVERLGAPVRLVPGLPGNLKITAPRTCRWRAGPSGEWRAGYGGRRAPGRSR